MGTLADGLSSPSLVHGPYHPRAHCRVSFSSIRSLSGLGRNRFPRIQSVALPLLNYPPRCPKRHFGEYELFPSLISLSPLPSAHPSAFQRTPVRASIPCYRNFTLAKGRSLGFASASTDFRPIRTRFRFGSSPKGINLASEAQLVGSLCKRHAVIPAKPGLRPLVGTWFQVLFHSPVRGTFHLSLTVLVHYRSPGSI